MVYMPRITTVAFSTAYERVQVTMINIIVIMVIVIMTMIITAMVSTTMMIMVIITMVIVIVTMLNIIMNMLVFINKQLQHLSMLRDCVLQPKYFCEHPTLLCKIVVNNQHSIRAAIVRKASLLLQHPRGRGRRMRGRISKRRRRGRGKAHKPNATRKPTCLKLEAIHKQLCSFLPPQLSTQYSLIATKPRLGQQKRRNSYNTTINTLNIHNHDNS